MCLFSCKQKQEQIPILMSGYSSGDTIGSSTEAVFAILPSGSIHGIRIEDENIIKDFETSVKTVFIGADEEDIKIRIDSTKIKMCEERGHVKPETYENISYTPLPDELIDTENISIFKHRLEANFKCVRCGQYIHAVWVTKQDTLWRKEQ